MSDQLYAYKNVVDGQKYVFAGPRPDLDARPNFERIDVGDVDATAVDAALRAKAQADSISSASKTRETQQNTDTSGDGNDDLSGGHLMPSLGAAGVFGLDTTGDPAKGGVLTRGVVKSAYTRAELEAKALADSTSLEEAGVLAAHVDNDLSRAALPGATQGVVVSEPPSEKVKSTTRSKSAKAMSDKTASFATPLTDGKATKPAAGKGDTSKP